MIEDDEDEDKGPVEAAPMIVDVEKDELSEEEKPSVDDKPKRKGRARAKKEDPSPNKRSKRKCTEWRG